MVDTYLVEINRLLNAAAGSAALLEHGQGSALRTRIHAAQTEAQLLLERHRREHQLGTPNH